MPLISWSDDMCVGVQAFDNHHTNLVNQINALNDAMRQGKGAEVLGPLLNNLLAYTKKHFDAEEQLLSRYNYPGYQAHKLEHKKLTDQVLAFQKEYEAGNKMLSIELMNFLRDWLTHHIKETDMKYGPFLAQQGVK